MNTPNLECRTDVDIVAWPRRRVQQSPAVVLESGDPAPLCFVATNLRNLCNLRTTKLPHSFTQVANESLSFRAPIIRCEPPRRLIPPMKV